MFVSVKEAAELTGKSTTTIYRLCNKRINTEYVKKEDNKFFIDVDFLKATYPEEEEAVDNDIIEIDEEYRETRSTNVIEEKETVELENKNNEEKSVVLETKPEEAVSTKSTEEKPKEENIELTIDDEQDTSKPKSWETFVGISASIILIALFIYLLSKYAL